jgi:hypothetical protein
MSWKKGRGKLGVLDPLMGHWIAHADSEMGPVTCTRTFARTLAGKYVELRVQWEFAQSVYEDLTLFGVGDDKVLSFWSFTSDGKRSSGQLAEAADVHDQAIAFEAQMPAGLARQVYWPDDEVGYHWAVESRNKKGWKRFVQHHYQPAPERVHA